MTIFTRKEMKKTLADMEISESGIVTKLRGNLETLRLLREAGIVLGVCVSRVRSQDMNYDEVCLHIDERRITVDDLMAQNVQISVTRVYEEPPAEWKIEQHRLAYLLVAR